jgi:hypothetical protein
MEKSDTALGCDLNLFLKGGKWMVVESVLFRQHHWKMHISTSNSQILSNLEQD